MGVFHEAGEALKDLFRHERVTIIDENGREVTKVIKPEPLQNPITLVRMMTWKACKCTLLSGSTPINTNQTIFPIRRVVLHRRFGVLDCRRL